MERYIDVLLLWILCVGLFVTDHIGDFDLCIILLAFSLTCFFVSYEIKWVHIGIGSVFLVTSFLIPETAVFLPLFVYNYFYSEHYVLLFFSILSAFNLIINQGVHLWIIIALIGIACMMAWRVKGLQQANKALRKFRDEAVEHELALESTNQKLMESQNAEVYTATLKERNRIAREIHDNVGHSLSSSILQVGALIAICKDEHMKPILKTLKVTLDSAMDNVRSSVHDLHDDSIDLENALKDMLIDFTFCETKLSYSASKNILANVKYCFIAVVKEALHNVVRHSNATLVKVTIKEHPAFYQLLIEDNGRIKSSNKPAGIGLTNMKDRVVALNGIIRITNEQGFRIFISVPKA